MLNIKNNPSEEFFGLIKGFDCTLDFFYSSRPPLCVQQEEVIPRRISYVIFVKLPFQLGLIFFCQVLIYVRSQEPIKLLFLEALLLFYSTKLLLTSWLGVVKIFVIFEIKGKLYNLG